MFKIKLNNTDFQYTDSSKSVLQNAIDQGVLIDYSCLSARCKTCAVKLLQGEVENISDEKVLTEQEKQQGYVLSCNIIPKSDLTLDTEDLSAYQLPTSQTIPAKIDQIHQETKDVISLQLRIPPTIDFKYLPGQYVNISGAGVQRSYSIAGQENNKLLFYIKNYTGGQMSDYWFNKAKTGDLLRVIGPKGTFFLRQSPKDIIFLATGTGIAPIANMIKEIRDKQITKRMILIWGGRQAEDVSYWKPNTEQNIQFIKVVSRSTEWEGERGHIQDVLLNQQLDLSKFQVYACGSSQMIDSAQKKLIDNGLDANDFYADAFVSSN